MFRKIADWASTESGKEVLTGVIVGIVGIIAVRLFCFIVCLATGYPINQEKLERIKYPLFFYGKINARAWKKCYWNNRITDKSRKHNGKCYGKDNTLLDKIAATTAENTSECGKTKPTKCVLRRGKTIVPSRTSAEKTMVLNRVWWAYTDKCYRVSRKRQRNI